MDEMTVSHITINIPYPIKMIKMIEQYMSYWIILEYDDYYNEIIDVMIQR